MKLVLEHPCSYARKNRLPEDIAYLCVEPDRSVSSAGLLELARSLLNAQDVLCAVIRPYVGPNYVCEYHEVHNLILSSAAEGYALIPASDRDAVQHDLREFDFSEESALVHRYRSELVVFLHHGHHSVDVFGSTENVTKCTLALLQTI